MHDSCVFRRSPIYANIQALNEQHILGDLAYPLMKGLLVPYKHSGKVTKEEEKYNYIHSKARCCIERAFGLLKGRFRRLKMLDMTKIEKIPDLIIACCILHNLCQDNDDSVDDDDISARDFDSFSICEVIESARCISDNSARADAVSKRHAICVQLNNM